MDVSYEQFILLHENQLISSGVPKIFWKGIFEKLNGKVDDSGRAFALREYNEEDDGVTWELVAIDNLICDNPENAFVIGNVVVTRNITPSVVGQNRPYLADFFSIEGEEYREEEAEEKTFSYSTMSDVDVKFRNRVYDYFWKYSRTATLVEGNSEDEKVVMWYIPDKVGVAIGHSLEPNVRMVPLFDAINHRFYSLIFPTKNILKDEVICRNFLEGRTFVDHPDWADVLMHPWSPIDLSSQPLKFTPKDEDYFMKSRNVDSLPSGCQAGAAVDVCGLMDKVKIYAPDLQLVKYLTNVQYELVDEIYSADIIWLGSHFHSFEELAIKAPDALINQFPYESTLTVKDLFAATVQSRAGFDDSFDPSSMQWSPKWFPATFNLNEDLPNFLTYYQRRAKVPELDNTWIIKPWNLARGLGIFITDRDDAIIRMAETGPRLASKYVDQPVLFKRPDTQKEVKFDLRYIVFVRSVDPLELFLYNKFWPRCAKLPFDKTNLEDTETHLTVFNYGDPSDVLNIKCDDFIRLLTDVEWEKVQKQIDTVIREVFEIATSRPPPLGMAPNKQSRGMYGLDLMLQKNPAGEPQVIFLEANFMPDCKRACDFYPDFADAVFQTLFLGGGNSSVRKI